MEYQYYAELLKPAWAPPAWLFGPVWTFLYAVIIVSFGFVFYKIWKRELPVSSGLPFAFNILFNAIFTPLQFGLRSNILAFIDILFVLGTLLWAMYKILPRIRWVALANIPYLAWVMFATILQATVTYLNL